MAGKKARKEKERKEEKKEKVKRWEIAFSRGKGMGKSQGKNYVRKKLSQGRWSKAWTDTGRRAVKGDRP